MPQSRGVLIEKEPMTILVQAFEAKALFVVFSVVVAAGSYDNNVMILRLAFCSVCVTKLLSS